MISPTAPQQRMLSIIREKGTMRSSELHAALIKLHEDVSLVSVKRALSGMTKDGFLSVSGAGRSTAYTLSAPGRFLTPVDARKYCAMEPDRRSGATSFSVDLFRDVPTELFTNDESAILRLATKEYAKRTKHISPTIAKKEMERLVIELSWKSSKIEGNTYTLLDTEKLLLEQKEAPGHRRDEAQMILNHKDAFALIYEHARDFRTLTRANLEHLHAIIVRGLNVGSGLRKAPVGVLGSRYQPLDNIHQITDAIQILAASVSRMQSTYAKALLSLLGISYIQPFEDGNKRTSRLMANALLLAHKCAPLSYRSVDETEYRDATIVFYELHSIVPLKKIFIEQYDFAARHYALA
ncbi:MAG: Fic family protein [Candidatus Peregrinibacteria bacterium]